MIAVVDYGMGNLRSVAKALEHVAPQESIRISSDPAEINRAKRIVLPGQGAMPDCMHYLKQSGLEDAVRRAAESRPLLAVCVGEQMLFEQSDETRTPGQPTPGLGLMQGQVRRFGAASGMQGRLKVPHMGWNQVSQRQPHALWEGVPDLSWFYFVHSYYVIPSDEKVTAGTSSYGITFTCVVARDNIFATQFHPEKSAAVGLRLYENFARWNP